MTQELALTSTEKTRLRDCEHSIRESYINVGNALREIRDSKLYRESHKTFQHYCEERWGYKKSAVYRLINSREIVDNLVEKCPQFGEVLPDNESQTRPLATLEPDEQVQVWKETVETAPKSESGRPIITAKHVEGVVQKLKAEDAKRPSPPPPTQDVVDLREIRKAFDILASIAYPGDTAYEKFGFPAFGPKADTACDWMMDFIGAHRGNSEIAIRLQDGSYWHPTNADVTLWRQTYPKVDIEAELRKCAAWNDANPSKRKTHKGVKRHVNTWLSSASDRLQKNGQAPTEFEGRHVEL